MTWHWQVRGPRPRFIYDNDDKKKELTRRIPFDVWLEEKKKVKISKETTRGKKETKANSDKAFQDWLKKKRVKKPKPKKKQQPVDQEVKRARMYAEWLERKRNEALELKKRKIQEQKRAERDKVRQRELKWKKKPVVLAYSQAV